MADLRAHMPDAVNVRGVMVGGVAVAVAVGIAIGIGSAFLLVRGDGGMSRVLPPHIAAVPALQAAPAQDMAAYRAEKSRQLHEYAWVDRERGIVRIPIERALELAVQRQAP